jgi:tetraprenyl-beta-curcumene synthase
MADRRPARALAAVIVRYLTTIQPHASRELARWRRRALAIPDPQLRAHVLHPFDADRSALGAALFAVLAPLRQQPALVRLLLAYVLLWSYVDVRTERDPHADPALYGALLDGLRGDPTRRDACADDGYLAALLAACNLGCAALPSWNAVAPTALQLADDGRTVQAINHEPPHLAATRLRVWGESRGGSWYEACAAASSPLTVHALMALAAHRRVEHRDAEATASAYGPVSALGVLCDHLIDHAEDQAAVNHSYLRYTDPRDLHDLADRACRSVRQLHDGERHTVILAAMAAMFLSRPHASSPTGPNASDAILDAIGPPAPQLRAALLAAHLRSPRAR